MSGPIDKPTAAGQETPPVFSTVNGWLDAAFEAHGTAVAVQCPEGSISYHELDARSRRIAAYLQSCGVAPGDKVGVSMKRSIDMVAVIIGILRAGAAYVPMDPAYPSNRLEIMVQDSGVAGVFVEEVSVALAGVSKVWTWADVQESLKHFESAAEPVRLNPEDPAYIIFTSGSTGRPKGIEMPHRALANLVEWQLERSSFRPGARVLQYSSISFDVSFQEIATTLASGGTLVLVDDAVRRDPGALLDYLVSNDIQRLFLPFVALRSLVQTAHIRKIYPEALTEIITAGEQLRMDDGMRAFFSKLDGTTLDNQYGPSETHVITANLLQGNPAAWPDLPSIGTPIKNCGVLILAKDGKPVEAGQAGEIYLGGRNLANGYAGRPDLTEQVFVENPGEASGWPRLYKTGDLGAINEDGTIRFLGRADLQVKIRGHRIEPGEIDNLVASYPGVEQSFTRTVCGSDQLRQLVVYVKAETGTSVEVSSLWKFLREELPEYMVPAFIIPVESVPQTPSGKVDLSALPEPSILTSRYADLALDYATETEEKLATVYGNLLGFSRIPAEADFFELGGDSLRAVGLFQQIHDVFGVELPLATLASSSTVRALAGVIDAGGRTDLSGYRALKRVREGNPDEVPLFMVHGGLGNLLVFGEFAENLENEMPIYGFQWMGWDGHAGAADVGHMAKTYVEELLAFHGTRPVRLAGYCIGGLIMLEMARMLKEAGVEVLEPLIAVDSPNLFTAGYSETEPWDSAARIEEYNRLIDEMNRLCEIELEPGASPVFQHGQLPGGLSGMLRHVPWLMHLLRKVRHAQETKGERLQMAEVRRLLKAGKTIPYELRETYCRKMLIHAARKHRARPYDGKVVYFRSGCTLGRYFALTGWWNDPYLGFSELCAGGFEAHVLEGDHREILGHPRLTQIIRDVFEDRVRK